MCWLPIGIHQNKYFPKISIPITKLHILITKTAAAAMSLIKPAVGFCSGQIKSIVFSIAVLMISIAITNPQQSKMMHHSVMFILK
ncbi:MAG: hypothetical protein RIQ70_857 [Bacteroidota bacterium]